MQNQFNGTASVGDSGEDRDAFSEEREPIESGDLGESYAEVAPAVLAAFALKNLDLFLGSIAEQPRSLQRYCVAWLEKELLLNEQARRRVEFVRNVGLGVHSEEAKRIRQLGHDFSEQYSQAARKRAQHRWHERHLSSVPGGTPYSTSVSADIKS